MVHFKWPDYAYSKLGANSGAPAPSQIRRLAFTACLFVLTFYLVISLLRTSHELVINDDKNRPLKEGEIEFTLEQCGCTRRITKGPIDNDIAFNQTTCGQDAYQRGTGQKIVGFSFYGDINSDYRLVNIPHE